MPPRKKTNNLFEFNSIVSPDKMLRFEFKGDIVNNANELAQVLFAMTNGNLFKQILISLHEQTDEETYKSVLAKWTEMEQNVLNACVALKKVEEAPFIDPMQVFQTIVGEED